MTTLARIAAAASSHPQLASGVRIIDPARYAKAELRSLRGACDCDRVAAMDRVRQLMKMRRNEG